MPSRVHQANGKPDYWDQALAELMKRDRVMRRLIPEHPAVWLESRGNPFVTLARSIVGQQISVTAAEAVWQRFLGCCGRRPTPTSVMAAGPEALRQSGLSMRKVEYVSDLALHFKNRTVRPARWADMDDDSVIAELTEIRGIGRWTAEMFLIFNLQRPNVLPLDDIGLLKAISLLYYSGERVSRFEAREVAQAWQPWCTVATWYLWRSLDPIPVEY
jgi:DNA-3-methyladenine glycosylase II